MTRLGLGGPKCLLNPPVAVPEPGGPEEVGVDWSQFAYVQYVTTPDYLCNAVMMFEALHRLGSRAERLLMYPSTYSLVRSSKMEGFLLLKARDEYGVTLVPIDVLSKDLSYRKSSLFLFPFFPISYHFYSTFLFFRDEMRRTQKRHGCVTNPLPPPNQQNNGHPPTPNSSPST